MKSAEVKLKERDLKATRLLLDRARKVYVEGMRLQILARQQREAQHEADDNSANVSLGHEPRTPKTPSASRMQHGEKPVPLPAEWHTMQAKVESLGAAGLARARTRWIQVSTKLEIVNGCVDFVNLSKLIQNVKLNKTARADSDSDSDTNPVVKDATDRTPAYVTLDHAQMLEKLRKAMSLTQSEILSAVVDWHQNELEMLDYCKLRLLSSGEGVAKQGDTLPYFIFVLRGSLKLVLPDPNLEEHQVRVVGKALRGMNFNFGQAESAHHMDAEVQSKDLAAQRGHLAYFCARRILGEAHVALQKPYYAHIVAMQDETEVLEFYVPPDTLTILKSFNFSHDAKRAELTMMREEGTPRSKMAKEDPSSDNVLRLTSADERVQTAHKR
jgi:CRP-like cAMP-binding protein